MPSSKNNDSALEPVQDFLRSKPEGAIALLRHFVRVFQESGAITLHPAKTMIGIATPRKRIAWITGFGRNFLHVVFPFDKAYPDNLCFQKIAAVPGGPPQFNHHFRMLAPEDINEEVRRFMKMALEQGS